MKRRFTILTAALALLISLAIPMGVWGQTRADQTVNWTATSGGLGSGIGSGTISTGSYSWSYTRTLISGSSYTGWTSNCIQLGKNGGVENLTLTTSAIPGTIKSVAVQCASYQGKHNVSITVGGNTYLASTATSSWTTVGTATGTGTSSGTITIAFTGGTRALYIKSISVVYDNSGGSNTFTVTYNGNGNTNGSVPTDNNEYENGDEVTVLGNAGNLAKTGHTFGGWCLNAEGTGTVYGPGTGQTATYTISANTTFYAKWIPNTHNITMPASDSYGSYSASATENVPYGSTVALTYAPASGYSNYEPSWTVNDEPISGNTFTMPDEDVTVGVTLNNYVKDQIDYAFTETNSGSYTNWNDKTGTSGAVYAGRSAGSSSQNYLQLNYSTSSSAGAYHSGIITTGSGGKVKKVVVTWAANGGTMPDTRVLKVFGSNTAYDEPANLYDSSTQGTQLGSIAKSTGTTLNIDGDYKYVGLLTDGAAYFTKIEVYWESSTDPSITADDVEIVYDATSGEIEYTLTNPATNGNLTVSENVDWISNAVVNTSESKVTFTTTANEATTAREGVITLTYTYGNNETVTKDVTITQAAAPVIYTTIPALFEAATSTATDVTITFGSWVISAVHNSNAYLTDNQGHGLIIYASNHGFQVNDVLTGSVSCKLQTYRGSAELTNLTSSTEGLNVVNNGTVSEQNIAINTLGGVNTGALLAYQGLTYNGTALVDGNNNTITPYSTLYSYTFEEGKTYNVTGIYLQYNSTKEILPRSASDIVEVTPVTSDKYVKVTSTTDLTSGQYLIVYEEGSVAFNGGLETLDAANNTIGVVIGNNEIAFNTTTAASEFTIDITAGTIKSASGYYIGRTSNSNGMDTDQETAYTNTISIDGDGNAVILASGGAYLRYNSNNDQNRFRYFKSDSYTGQKAIQLYKKVSEFPKTITAYTSNDNGWYLIATPIGEVAPGNVANMIDETAANYDLFIFDQTNASEWQNYKQNHFTTLEPGKGYLYANKNTVDLEFTGTAYTGEGTFPLVYSTVNSDSFMHGWNLMGNPYGESASVDRPYYTLNGDFEYELAEEDESVEAMEGIFVHVTEAEYNANQYVTFTPVSQQQQGGSKGSSLTLNLNKGGKLLDRAIISFSQGHTLPKFQFDRNHTKVYIPQDGQDYAIVRGEEMGEMPVNFKAENNGTYSLSYSSRNAEFAYLHLIDNMTGADVDLLQTQSYSFDARTTDYESRFKLVFATGDNSKDDNFAFFSNGSFVINNEGNATLQVIDVTGRIISSESVNGCTNVNVNAAPGVYMLRLVNGENVRVQKVVVK